MYINPIPGGLNGPSDTDRQPIWRVTSGDEWLLSTRLVCPWAPATPATPTNSRVLFCLAEDRFDTRRIWSTDWNAGVVPVISGQPGLVTIRIPDDVTARLRRGTYSFALQVTDPFGHHRQTVLAGTLLVEYEPTSMQHNIPYQKPREPAYAQ